MSIRVTAVSVLPQCNFCKEPARYDFRMKSGTWANACEEHWREFRAEPGLGLGAGQLLITVKEARKMIAPFTERIVAYQNE
jgi:hypothetical protein